MVPIKDQLRLANSLPLRGSSFASLPRNRAIDASDTLSLACDVSIMGSISCLICVSLDGPDLHRPNVKSSELSLSNLLF